MKTKKGFSFYYWGWAFFAFAVFNAFKVTKLYGRNTPNTQEEWLAEIYLAILFISATAFLSIGHALNHKNTP